MGTVHYWREYINKINSEKKFSSKYTLELKENQFLKCFFFEERKEIISFIKYVVLPSFIYIKIGIEPLEETMIKVQDYKETLNFFVSNNIPSSNELIRRYSFFYNSLEEFEYESLEIGEESFNELMERFNEYFKKDKCKPCEIKIKSI